MFDMITHATYLFEDEACLCVAPFQFRLMIQFVTLPIMWIIPTRSALSRSRLFWSQVFFAS